MEYFIIHSIILNDILNHYTNLPAFEANSAYFCNLFILLRNFFWLLLKYFRGAGKTVCNLTKSLHVNEDDL